MSTPERTSRGGRDDDDFDGVDAFGLDPADGDEEIFEWIGGDEEDEASPDRLPRMSFRDALRQLRANRRAVTRRAVVLLTTTAVVAGAAIGFTSWFDAVSRAADNAAVANVALDSVVDGDPAVAKFDAKTTNGTQQFVLEVANNGPDTVTLLGVSIDAGSLMTSKLWKPMGSPAIPAGGTGLVAVTVDLNCDLVMVSQSLGRGSVSFPNVDVTVRTGNGDVRKTTLRTRSDVTRAVGAVTQQDGTITTDPQIVMGGERGCLQMIEQRGADQGNTGVFGGGPPGITTDPSKEPVTVTYTGVEKAATSGTQSYLLGFTAHNSSRDFSVKLSSEAQAPVGDLTTNLVPTTVDVPPGGSASFALEVRITVCDSGNGLGSGEVSQFRVRADSGPDNVLISPLGGGQFSSLGRLLTGSGVQLALDELAQLKAACQ